MGGRYKIWVFVKNNVRKKSEKTSAPSASDEAAHTKAEGTFSGVRASMEMQSRASMEIQSASTVSQ